MAGGFAQTDLTGEADATGGAQGETVGQAGGGAQAAAELSSGTAVASSSDSFLLQGTTGQGLAATGPVMMAGGPGGPGGPGGFNADSLAPSAPG